MCEAAAQLGPMFVHDKLLINCKTVCLIVKDELYLWNLCAKLVPKNLTEEQKKRNCKIITMPYETKKKIFILCSVCIIILS